MEIKLKETLESLIKLGIPKEVIIKYLGGENINISPDEIESFQSSIKTMFIFYVQDDVAVDEIDVLKLKEIICDVLKIKNIENTIAQLDRALIRLERIRADNAVSRNYASLLNDLNEPVEDNKKFGQFQKFCKELKDGVIEFPDNVVREWPENFIKHISSRYADIQLDYKPSLSSSVEMKVDRILDKEISSRHAMILRGYYGLNASSNNSFLDEEVKAAINEFKTKTHLLYQ